MLAAVIAEAAAIVLLGVLVVGLLRSHAEILRALHDLGVDLDPDRDWGDRPGAGRRPGDDAGRVLAPPVTLWADAEAHDVVGERLDGSQVGLAVAGAEHDTLLMFLSGSCASCRPFWDALRAGATAPGARVLAVAESHDSRSRLRELAGNSVDVVLSDTAWREYDVPGSPHAVLVHGPTSRVIGEGTAPTFEQLVSLLQQAAEGRAQPAAGPRPVGWAAGRDNATRVDAELSRAGIGAGHPSLYPTADPAAAPDA